MTKENAVLANREDLSRRSFIASAPLIPIAGVAAAAPEATVINGISYNASEKTAYDMGYDDGLKWVIKMGEEIVEARPAADPHVEWFEQWKIARQAWCEAASGHDHEWDHAATKAAEKEEWRLSKLITGTVAETKEGLLMQLEYWIADFGDGYCGDTDLPEYAAILSMQAGLQGLAG